MNTVARQLIMRSHDTGRDFATVDEAAERELLSGGYAERTNKPLLMRLTKRGRSFAEKEKAWLRSGR